MLFTLEHDMHLTHNDEVKDPVELDALRLMACLAKVMLPVLQAFLCHLELRLIWCWLVEGYTHRLLLSLVPPALKLQSVIAICAHQFEEKRWHHRLRT